MALGALLARFDMWTGLNDLLSLLSKWTLWRDLALVVILGHWRKGESSAIDCLFDRRSSNETEVDIIRRDSNEIHPSKIANAVSILVDPPPIMLHLHHLGIEIYGYNRFARH